MTATGLKPTTIWFVKEHLTIWPFWPNHIAELWVLICTLRLTVCSCDVMYAYQSEFTLYICLNVKDLFTRNRRNLWNLSNCTRTRTHKHLVPKPLLNHLAKLTKWLAWILSTYLHSKFDCMFFLCHVSISEWIHTLYLPECQGNPHSKYNPYIKFKELQQESNQQPLSS